jgi:hypothetical protein
MSTPVRSLLSVGGILLAGAMCLTACVSTPHPPGDASRGAPAPAFTGPYAAELEAAWRESDSDFVRSVVADEAVSDQEWAELGTRMTECLADAGLEFGGFRDDGSYTVGPSLLTGDDVTRVLDSCERSTGELWLHALRMSMSSNPDNLPIHEVMTQCLIRNGAVEADYTKEQFAQDAPAQSFPFMGTDKESVFWACNDDPSYAGAAG